MDLLAGNCAKDKIDPRYKLWIAEDQEIRVQFSTSRKSRIDLGLIYRPERASNFSFLNELLLKLQSGTEF
ncbi:hypothetical protein M514_01084 [Trichuris suis]|uniref:Uncharacterized protein n=1 Tax=Trichuris suis TaxID=68888 RepID=A0A085MS17_9BILA|nr:hypothetical protein M513_01084 [Trichuris suis]KFD60013.1 hypothetical protein M514_01084 [Trichuris suis]